MGKWILGQISLNAELVQGRVYFGFPLCGKALSVPCDKYSLGMSTSEV